MRPGLERLQAGRTTTWRTILGLLLVPLTAAGVLLWGLWNPTDRLDTVTAAVVNLDEPVTVDGQMVPMGRVLAAELIDGDADTNFTWLLTDEEDANEGLEDGRYATVVTIPENFSAAATSMSDAVAGTGDAEQATIDITTSDRGRLLDSALSGIVTSTATSVLNEQLGAQSVQAIFVGMSSLGDGIEDAADGAEQLADGGKQLADGAGELATGAAGLADGTQQLAQGTADLATGAEGLAGGASDLAGGMRLLASGDGGDNPGLAGLASGVSKYTQGVNEALSGLQAGAGAAVEPLQQLLGAIEGGLIPFASPEDQKAAEDGLEQLIEQLSGAASEDPGSPIQQLKDSGTALAGGVQAAAGGAADLANGAETLAGGMAEFSDGAQQLASGTPTLAAGASELAGGAAGLADGAKQAADGTAGLAEGLNTAVEEIPSFSDSKAESLAKTAVQPVEATGENDELFNAAGVPLFAGIALWAGAFASFLVLAPLWRRTREAARGIGYITLRSALPVIGLGAAQGAFVGIVLPLLLGYDFGQIAGFFGLSVIAGVAFSLVNQGLSAFFGGLGRFVSFALLVVAFAIGVISTAPPLLQAVGDASPIGALFGGFQAIAMGMSGLGAAILALIVWGAGGLALTAFAVMRARRRIEP